MEINDKKLKRTSKIINWTISIVLALFLILLSSLVIDDLNNTVTLPRITEYTDQNSISELEATRLSFQNQSKALYEVKENYQKMSDVAMDNKNAEQESFDNWIKTRNSIGNPNQDKEVLQRTYKMDEYRSIVQQWNSKCDSIQKEIDLIQAKSADSYEQIEAIERDAERQYLDVMNSYDLKVFLIRLLFVAPILALGIFFFIRYRNHKFGPMFMGFTLFSVYAFFFGLVPYLPSYGGYIRYSVGILLTIGLGYYAIKRLKDYSERKKVEMRESTTERSKKIQNDISEKAFNNHICPSCGKDFLLKSWENKAEVNKQGMQMASEYCRFCGLQILKKCSNCGHQNYAHLPYCVLCGTNIK